MSNKVYRLLRYNKEQGSFTIEELVQKNLKPYDLIWVEGRSSAWSYPGELPEFKMFVARPGEQQSVLNKKQPQLNLSASVQAAVAINNNTSTAEKKEKPRYKVSAAWSKIQTVTAPVYEDVVAAQPEKIIAIKSTEVKQPVDVYSKSLSWEDAWKDWETEKTGAVTVTPEKQVEPLIVLQQKKMPDVYAEPVLETKYSQPLDAIKQQYIESILQQKQRSQKSFLPGKVAEFIIPSLALIIIFSVGYWFLHAQNSVASSALSSVHAKAADVNNQQTNNTDAGVTNSSSEKSGGQNIVAAQQTTAPATNNKTDYTEPAKLTTAESRQPQNVRSIIKSQAPQTVLPETKSAENKQAKQADENVINTIAYNNATASANGDINAAATQPLRRSNDVETNGKQPATSNATPVVKHFNAKSVTNYVSAPEYIAMNDGSADVKIQNISNVDLDLVVVDVLYYDGSNRFRKGETLYLHNLKAGKNVLIKTPRDIDSYYATSKVSLVSSDANNVYVVGDN